MNYTGKHIKTLKTFLNNAHDQGIEVNQDFKSRKFTVHKEETESIYLNEVELNKIWNEDLTKEPREELARDLFLIGAYTGLRVSDYNSLTEQNIKFENGVEMIKIKTQKTGQTVAIPLLPIVKSILTKYGNKPPQRIPDQEINELIKKVGEKCKINEPVKFTYNRGGMEVSETKPKFKLITNHTARRSFCTNAYLAGVRTLDIMAISGHTTEKNFKKYIKVTAEQHAIEMSKHAFFQGAKHLKVV